MSQLSRLIFGVIAALAIAAPVAASAHCELTVVLVDPAAAFHRVSGAGFAPNEEVELQLYLDNEAVFLAPLQKTADSHGKFFDGLTMLPKDPVGTYTMRATAASCTAETTFEWSLPDTAVVLPIPAAPSAPDHAWVFVAGLLVFAYMLISPRWARAEVRSTLPERLAEPPSSAAASPPELRWALVVGVVLFAYVLISPLWAGARRRNSH